MGFKNLSNQVTYTDNGGSFDNQAVDTVEVENSLTTLANNALSSANAANTSKEAAEAAKTAAETAETNAETAETNAETAETNAETAETNAAASATASANSATAGANSATAAATSETNAASSANTATTKANTATTQATNSANSATASATSATNSANSATAAQTARTNAETAETNAETAETNAETAETNAAASAVTAATQATNSSNSATAAATSATAAQTAQTAAETAETNAETAETNAETAETNAAASASTASTHASTATTKASEASTSATNAASSATNAANSATGASNSQIAAASSAASAAAIFDQFDDTYLGTKSSAPTVDNDGNALATGALYYNSSTQGMFIWTGSEWVAASAAGGASLNNFSYTATAGQTTFSGSDENSNTMSYTVDNIIVTLNGVVLEGGGTDYTATNGSSVVLTTGAVVSDEVNIVAFKTFTTADMVSASNGGAYQGNVDFAAGIDVTGNITVTGTVDGRDLAADGTKLDALEANANVTDTANVTAAGALMDSEVTNLAQVKAFDSSDYATAAQGATANNALPKAGGAMTGAITTNSTFDGRDIATDGAKLDGIETGATADQTAAEIKVAYESNSDTNEFSDAEQTKLSNIEANATADQTAAEIKTLVGSATDSNVFTDADHTKLDGIETAATADQTKADIEGLGIDVPAANLTGTIDAARLSTATTQAESDDSTKIATTAYVTDKIETLIGGAPGTLNDLNELAAAINDDANYNSTLTTALSTKLPLAGGTLTGDLSFGDSDKAIFGAGSDLQIYHDGSNSYVKDNGTGQLILQGSTKVILKGVNGDNFLQGNEDGAVNLYHNDAQKLATTATGIDVTGSVTADGGDFTGQVQFNGTAGIQLDNGAQAHTWTLDDHFTSRLNIGTSSGSAAWKIGSNNNAYLTVNPTGIDVTGTVTSDGLTSTTSSSMTQLTVNGTGSVESGVNFANGGTTYGQIYFNNTSPYDMSMMQQYSTGSLIFGTNDTERMRIDSSGNLLVGTTDTSLWNDNANEYGHNILAHGQYYSSTNGEINAYLNRQNSDGAIIAFAKDGSLVGSIGTVNADIYIGNGDAGLHFNASGDQVLPINVGTKAYTNGFLDLGANTARFKDLYLSDAIRNPSGNLTVDVSGYIYLDTDGGLISLKDGGSEFAQIYKPSAGGLSFWSPVADTDIKFQGSDNGSLVDALRLDMSNGGQAIFSKGASFQDHVYLQDNDKLVLGGGDDLQIYHDGSHSYIQNNTGYLHVNTANFEVKNVANNETMILATQNGAVKISYNDSVKLATTSSGVSVTGTVAATSYTGDGSNLTGISSGAAFGTTYSTPSRAGSNTAHQNTGSTYKIVMIDATGNADYLSVSANGSTWHQVYFWDGGTGTYERNLATIIVPPGHYWRFSGSSYYSLVELS